VSEVGKRGERVGGRGKEGRNSLSSKTLESLPRDTKERGRDISTLL